MNIEEKYQHILNEIQLGHRALMRYSNDELEELNSLLERTDLSHEKLQALLCVIEHSSGLYPKFEKNLLQLINSELPDHLIIFALNCARKHIVEARFQRGLRLEYEFLETLKKLLTHPNPEVVEWTLRLIESCGNQGVYFLNIFDKIKPPPWKWFNQHQRAVREIITLLERRWSPIEKPKS